MNTCKKIIKRFQVAKSQGQCVRSPMIKDRKYFGLLRYGSYKSFIIQSRQMTGDRFPIKIPIHWKAMETAVKRFQSACSTLFKSTSIVLNQRSRIRFLDIQLEEIANRNFTGQHYTDSNWYRTPPLVPFVRCHNGFMDHPGPEVFIGAQLFSEYQLAYENLPRAES